MPKILHIYWDTGKLYTLYEYQLQRCLELNPGWELYFWTEKNLTQLGIDADLVARV